MTITSLSPRSYITLNSGKTVADIIAIVNYALGKMRKPWNISESEAEDLLQDGYLAAIGADKSYNPRKAAWSTWVLKRVNGQLRTSIERLRSFGIVGTNTDYPKRLLDVTVPAYDRDSEDEEVQSSVDDVMSTELATDDAADISSNVATLLSCVSERSKNILSLYYGLDDESPSLSTTQLAKQLGYSRKHAFELLQRAQQEARSCLGVER
jgi:RNA polymerase sigma factor (sigma-70 family)